MDLGHSPPHLATLPRQSSARASLDEVDDADRRITAGMLGCSRILPAVNPVTSSPHDRSALEDVLVRAQRDERIDA